MGKTGGIRQLDHSELKEYNELMKMRKDSEAGDEDTW
jgi:hypothetical protein